MRDELRGAGVGCSQSGIRVHVRCGGMMEQANLQQVSDQALQTKSGEVAMPIGSEERTLETEAGGVS